MIEDPQEYLQQWEKENNPFYPDEMRWDRVKVNTFLKDWKQQCNIADVVGQSEQLVCESCKQKFTPIDKWNFHCQECQPCKPLKAN